MAEIQYREALKRALREEMQRDPNIVMWGEDIVAYAGGGAYAVTTGLAKEFPGRVMDTPIAEEGIVGVGIGAAMAGMRPVVEIMTVNFLLPAWDQLVNHAAKQHHMFNGTIKVPMVIRTPNGHGRTAATHSQNFDNWLASIPGIKVVSPSTRSGDARRAGRRAPCCATPPRPPPRASSGRGSARGRCAASTRASVLASDRC